MDSPPFIYKQPSNQWFEGPATRAAISLDGKWALFTTYGKAMRLVSLETGDENSSALSAGLDSTPDNAVFCGNGLLRLGKHGTVHGWFLSIGHKLQLTSAPADAFPQCSSDGKQIAYFFPEHPDAGVFVGSTGTYRHYQLAGKVTAVVFTPDTEALYVLAFGVDGRSSLVRITASRPGVEMILGGLDSAPSIGNIAIAPDGRSLFLALVSDAAPDNAVRSQPTAHRWLKIYRLDLRSGTRHVVAESTDQDNFDPFIASGHLYWNRNQLHAAIAVVRADGGEARELVEGGELPIWNFDGKWISYFVGGWRLADWAINLDAAIIRVNQKAERVSEQSFIVSGFHEDFPQQSLRMVSG